MNEVSRYINISPEIEMVYPFSIYLGIVGIRIVCPCYELFRKISPQYWVVLKNLNECFGLTPYAYIINGNRIEIMLAGFGFFPRISIGQVKGVHSEILHPA